MEGKSLLQRLEGDNNYQTNQPMSLCQDKKWQNKHHFTPEVEKEKEEV